MRSFRPRPGARELVAGKGLIDRYMAKYLERRYVVAGLIGFSVLFGLAFWWYWEHVFYRETQASSVRIAGTDYPVTEWRGIDAENLPLEMRACFVIGDAFEAPPALSPEPPVAPGWFKCFDTDFIIEYLARNYAKAYVAERDDPKGFDRMIAVFPSGWVYMWRQPNQTNPE